MTAVEVVPASASAPELAWRSVSLPSDVRAPRTARRMVRRACGERPELPIRLVDDATFVVGEIVFHAVRDSRARLEVAVDVEPDEVLIRVAQNRDNARGPTAASLGAIRSWEVVRRLSSSYGYSVFGGAPRHLGRAADHP